MGNDRLSSKQVGSQASRLAWIQPVCISMNAVQALKGLTVKDMLGLQIFFLILLLFNLTWFTL